jgi:hypothetical protein
MTRREIQENLIEWFPRFKNIAELTTMYSTKELDRILDVAIMFTMEIEANINNQAFLLDYGLTQREMLIIRSWLEMQCKLLARAVKHNMSITSLQFNVDNQLKPFDFHEN